MVNRRPPFFPLSDGVSDLLVDQYSSEVYIARKVCSVSFHEFSFRGWFSKMWSVMLLVIDEKVLT